MKIKHILYSLIYLILITLIVLVARQTPPSSYVQGNLSATPNAERKAMRQELTTIKAELTQLQAQIDATISGPALINLLCAEPDERILTDIVPHTDHYGYPGIIAISEAFFPGMDGCLSLDAFLGLLEKGWSYCLTVTADTDLPSLVSRSASWGIPATHTAYFPNGDYGDTWDSLLCNVGINTVLQYGMSLPDYTPSIMTVLPVIGNEESHWYDLYQLAYSTSSALFITEGYQNPREICKAEEHNIAYYMDSFMRHTQSGDLVVTSLTNAYEVYTRRVADHQAITEASFDRISYLNERKTELESLLYGY